MACSTLASRLRLYRSLASRLELVPKPNDWTGHSLMHYRNKSGSTKKEKIKSRTSPVSISPIKCAVTGRFYYRLWIHGLDPPDFLYLVKHSLRDGLHQMRSPRPLLGQMIVYGNIPDLASFSIIIQSYCKQRLYHRVHDAVFTQMKALGVKPNISFYRTLINGVCASFGPVVAYKLLKRLNQRNQVQTPLSCYNAIVGQFRKREIYEDWSMGHALNDLLMYMRRHQLIPQEEILNCLVEISVNRDVDIIKAVGVGRQIIADGIKTGAAFFASTL